MTAGALLAALARPAFEAAVGLLEARLGRTLTPEERREAFEQLGESPPEKADLGPEWEAALADLRARAAEGDG
ncbi:MAG: hypothetical protein AAGH15_27925 [Myxococcota bacterium]